jgi:hypothetical protein
MRTKRGEKNRRDLEGGTVGAVRAIFIPRDSGRSNLL